MLVLLGGCMQENKDTKEAKLESSADAATLNEVSFAAPVAKTEHMVADELRVTDSVGNTISDREVPRMRITQGLMSVESPDLKQSRRMVDSLCKQVKGWLASESISEEGLRYTMTLALRIPAPSFNQFVHSLEQGQVGKMVSKSTSTEDITAAYVDNESRITSEQAYLQRYRQMLQKAKSVKEMLEIEERIRLLTEEMESRIGQRKVWDQQVSYSNLSLEIYQNKPYVYPGDAPLSFVERVKAHFFRGGQRVVDLSLGIISYWPYLILGFGALLWWRKRRSTQAVKP